MKPDECLWQEKEIEKKRTDRTSENAETDFQVSSSPAVTGD